MSHLSEAGRKLKIRKMTIELEKLNLRGKDYCMGLLNNLGSYCHSK